MKKPVHLEGGLIVELTNGDHRHIICCPIDRNVIHSEAGVAFGERKSTNEVKFRQRIKRIVSRSSFDKR